MSSVIRLVVLEPSSWELLITSVATGSVGTWYHISGTLCKTVLSVPSPSVLSWPRSPKKIPEGVIDSSELAVVDSVLISPGKNVDSLLISVLDLVFSCLPAVEEFVKGDSGKIKYLQSV